MLTVVDADYACHSMAVNVLSTPPQHWRRNTKDMCSNLVILCPAVLYIKSGLLGYALYRLDVIAFGTHARAELIFTLA